MVKKDFKKAIAKGADKFFSVNDESRTDSTQRTHSTHDTHKTYYRINLKLDAEHEEYLKERAWEKKQSVTQYINDLIAADKLL